MYGWDMTFPREYSQEVGGEACKIPVGWFSTPMSYHISPAGAGRGLHLPKNTLKISRCADQSLGWHLWLAGAPLHVLESKTHVDQSLRSLCSLLKTNVQRMEKLS